MSTLKELNTEFSEILAQLDRLLDKIEREIPFEDRTSYFNHLCSPKKYTFDRPSRIRSQTEQDEIAIGASQYNDSSTENNTGIHFQSISAHASPTNDMGKDQTRIEISSGPTSGGVVAFVVIMLFEDYYY